MDIFQIRDQMRSKHLSIYDIPLRVTFYGRVSTKKDEQLNSIENQVSHFEELIKNNPHWTYIEGYVDEIRGESAANRDNFLRMIHDAEAGKIDLILTKEISRFARDTIDSLKYTRHLLSHGVCVLFESDSLNTIEPDSELRLTIMASIAQDEVRKLSSRVKFGHNRSIKDGNVLGNSAIYGYRKNDCRLEIVEDEAEMVRLVFDLYISGNSSSQIENILWDKGYRNKKNGGRIASITIRRILQNPKYKGYYCGGKVIIEDYRTKKQRFIPSDEWVMYKDETGGTVPAIVSEETWDLANKIYQARSQKVINKEHSLKSNLYTGKLYCGIHNVPFWKNSYSSNKNGRKTKDQWRCSQRYKVDENNKRYKCDTFPIFEYELNEIVKQFFTSLANTATTDYLEAYIEMIKETETAESVATKIKPLQNNLQKIQAKKDKLLELSLEGAIDNAEFAARNDKFNEEIEAINRQLLSLSNSKQDISRKVQSVHDLKNFLDHELNPENENFISSVMNRFVDKMVVTPIAGQKDSISIDFVLNTGNTLHTAYNRENWCSDTTLKKMVAFAEQAIAQGQTAAINSAVQTQQIGQK